eukprot:TRINITY_DN2866_c0_g1_i2.p2 TRINITY_DN2866_c0_g1~~TRINITY_DN2866_c0_g1_i2.p2  ORF type:complete len:380 (+),score=87.71 TRINITY_DN2866_c0_g1_i2:72-1211(+)
MANDSTIVQTIPPWFTRVNDIMTIKFIGEGENPDEVEGYQPEFTHQVFRDDETVYGYKGLRINLYFRSGSMRAFPLVTWEQLVPADAMQEADDVRRMLLEKLPIKQPGAVSPSLDSFLQPEKPIKPAGELVDQCALGDEVFEFYFADIDNTREYHERMQILVLFYIDGSSYIDSSDSRWKVFTVFRLHQGRRELAAYCTVYPFYVYPDNLRYRISQILVLPRYRRRGIAGKLIRAIYRQSTQDPKCVEVVVEDPSDGFRKVRDITDLQMLREKGLLQNVRPGERLDATTVAKVKAALPHISKAQLRRCFEVLMLNNTSRADEESYKAFRLFVKQRLHKQYQEELSGIDEQEGRLKFLQDRFEETVAELMTLGTLMMEKS